MSIVEVKQPKIEIENMAKINGVSADFYLFHANRIGNIVMGMQTPMNDFNEGITDCGNYKVPLNDSDGVVCEILSCLTNMGHLDVQTCDKLKQQIRLTNTPSCREGLSALFD